MGLERGLDRTIVHAPDGLGLGILTPSDKTRIAEFGIYINKTIDSRGNNIIILPDGKAGIDYPWSVMGRLEKDRLFWQSRTFWGQAFKEEHHKLAEACSPARIGIIGVSDEAEQVRYVRQTHPQAEIVVVEFDKRKAQAAEAVLSSTNNREVRVVQADAGEFLQTQKDSFDYIEADKVLIHATTPLRKALYQAIESALKVNGIFAMRDILAKTWKVDAAEDAREDPSVNQACVDSGVIMQDVLRGIWTGRGIYLWSSMDEMSQEAMTAAPSLRPVDQLNRIYQAPATIIDHPLGLISLTIVTQYGVGQNIAVARNSGDAAAVQEASRRWENVERFREFARTPGIKYTLPDYANVYFQKVA